MTTVENFTETQPEPKRKNVSDISELESSLEIMVETYRFKWCLENMFLYHEFPVDAKFYGREFCAGDMCLGLALTVRQDLSATVRLEKREDFTIPVNKYRISVYDTTNGSKALNGEPGEEAFYLFSDDKNAGKPASFHIPAECRSLRIVFEMRVLKYRKQPEPLLTLPIEFSCLVWICLIICLVAASIVMVHLFNEIRSGSCALFYRDMHQLVLETSSKLLHVGQALNMSQEHLTTLSSLLERDFNSHGLVRGPSLFPPDYFYGMCNQTWAWDFCDFVEASALQLSKTL